MLERRRETSCAAAAAPACPRCGATMAWIHASWQCTACKFKEGCCG